MHTHQARKRFGQHFLHDKQIIQRIIDLLDIVPGEQFIEIGPGQGALTVPLLKHTQHLDAIELDRDLIPALELRCADKGALTVHQADVLEFDFTSLISEAHPVRIIGNLPYNISTPLIFHLLQYAPHIRDMHFMLQKEVVDRMAAAPGNGEYGRLSIMVQYHCEVTALFDVPPSAFYPPPQVISSIVRLIPHKEIKHFAVNYAYFEKIVKEAFSHRRKTLRNSLKEIVNDEDWKRMAIDPQLRPEQLSVLDYVKISNQMMERANG